MVHTPRIPVWGGLMTGVKLSTPKPPRLETVKLAPVSLSGLMAPSRASAASTFSSLEISRRLFSSACMMVGTIRPRGVSTATPRLTWLNLRMLTSSSMWAFRSGQPGNTRDTA